MYPSVSPPKPWSRADISQLSFLSNVKRRWSEFVSLERLSVLGKEVFFTLYQPLTP